MSSDGCGDFAGGRDIDGPGPSSDGSTAPSDKDDHRGPFRPSSLNGDSDPIRKGHPREKWCGRLRELSSRVLSPGGSRTRSTVSPGWESMAIVPPCRSTTMRRAMSRPRPVPLPTPLVVKNGSNARAATSGVMPGAGVADLDDHRVAVGAGRDPQRARARPSRRRALSIRLVHTWLSSPAYASIRGRRRRSPARPMTPSRSLWPSIISVLSSPPSRRRAAATRGPSASRT